MSVGSFRVPGNVGGGPCPDATVTFDGLPFLSVPSDGTVDIDCNTLLDAAYAVDGGAVTGTYTLSGTANGRNVYTKDVSNRFEYSGTRWELIKTGADYLAAVGAETYPWEADWSATAVTVTQSTIGGVCEDCPACDDATAVIKNSAGTTLDTEDIPSGASEDIIVADSTITRPDGTTVGLAATVALDVRDYRSAIAYNFGRILHSGQTTSYRSGDEGTMFSAGFFDYTRPVYPVNFAELGANILTLAANNIHGNTNRFTTRAGGAYATSGDRIVRDHWLKVDIYILGTFLSGNWNTVVDSAATVNTALSETGWYHVNDRMLDLFTDGSIASPLNYGPFNTVLGGNFWTVTTNANTTTNAYFLTNQGGFGNGSAKTTALLYGIYVKPF